MKRYIRDMPFAGHLLAYCLSEAAGKASRLLVVIVVARCLEAEAIGIAAAAFAAADILKSLTENGVGQRIIRAKEADLAATCLTAHRIFWVWCLGLFGLQMLGGVLVWMLSGNALMFTLIAVLAAEYLFMPAGLVQAALAMRAGKLKQTAAIAGGQVVFANFMTALLVLVMPGPLALVLPRLMSAPVWLLAMRRLHPWTRTPGVASAPLRPFLRYGGTVLGVELVKAMGPQADKLVIGGLMGVEALGYYFLAFNAGLGLANSLSQAFATAFFPHLCSSKDRSGALRKAVGLSLGVIAPLVILQSLAAPYYVPILFGADWAELSDIVATLCLAAVPGVIWSAAAQWLRAHDAAERELVVTAALTLSLIGSAILLAPYGLGTVALGYLVVTAVIQIGAALPILTPAFAPLLRKAS